MIWRQPGRLCLCSRTQTKTAESIHPYDPKSISSLFAVIMSAACSKILMVSGLTALPLAGYDFARYFKRLWDQPSVPKSAVKDLKTSLARVYSAAPDTVRRNIINSALEQLFQTPDILKYFADWKEDALLKSAYDDARESVLGRNAAHQKGHVSE